LSTDFKGFEAGLKKHRIPRDKREEMKGKWEKQKALNKANDITRNLRYTKKKHLPCKKKYNNLNILNLRWNNLTS